MNWRWITIAAVLATGVAGYNELTRRDPSDVAATEPPVQPGYFLTNAIITQTEKDGSTGMRLIAERIDQQRDDDSILLRTVRVEVLNTPDRQWILTAQNGFVPSGSRIVEFTGNVNLRPIDSSENAFLHTDALAIDTEKQIAYSTISPVDIRYGRLEMRVKRFEADLKTERVKLESVRGHSDSAS